MTGQRSIRSRVVSTQLLWSLVGGLALAAAVWIAVQHEVDELLDDTLRSAAEDVIGPMVEPFLAARAAAVPAAVPVQSDSADSPRFVWQVAAPASASDAPPVLVAAARGAPGQALHATPRAGFADVGPWRVFGLPLGQGGLMLYVAQTRAERSEAKLELIFVGVVAGLPMLLLGLVWLNARVREDLRPLQALSQRLTGYDPLRPGATLGAAEAIELQPVHAAIDALATRLSLRVARERSFSSHAAHALRTPLAGIDAQLAVALREAPPALRERLERVRTASTRLQHVVAALLAFFRSGLEVQRAPLDLAALAARLPSGPLRVQVRPGSALDGDADLLAAALLNLLDNAAAHGASAVTLSAPEPGVLHLQDDGAGVDAVHLQALQQALDTQEYAGRTGLGLMLADMVARAHGGRLALGGPGPGFTVRLHLLPPGSRPPAPR